MDIKVLAGNRKADTYLFVAADKDIDELPEALLTLLGEMRDVLEMDLTEERQLVRCWYYLQMPPAEYTHS